MAADVFLSYARSTSRDHAREIRAELERRGVTTFLDEADLDVGQRFPEAIIDALLGARVVVCLADRAYFMRRYCTWESRVALLPYETVSGMPQPVTPADRARHEATVAAALDGVMLVVPPEGQPDGVGRFPVRLQGTHAPRADAPRVVSDAVVARLRRVEHRLADRLDALPATGGAAGVRRQLADVVLLPPPQAPGRIPVAPPVLPQSLGEQFYGRADTLWTLHNALRPAPDGAERGQVRTAVLTAAVRGTGGVGKTQLAREYVRRFGPLAFGALFWIDADASAATLRQRWHDMLVALTPPNVPVAPLRDYEDPKQRLDLSRDLQRAVAALPPERPALVVVDNVPEPGAAGDADGSEDAPGTDGAPHELDAWCPVMGLAAVLVTSRVDVGFEDGAGDVRRVFLGVLSREEAVALLTGDGGRGTLSQAQWETIAEWVGDLPLALTMIRRMLRGGGLSPSDVLEMANSEASPTREIKRGMESLKGQVPAAALRGIVETFAASYGRLTSDARDAARLLAALAPAPIPLELVDAASDVFTPEVRSELILRSWVAPATGAVPMFGTMHRVVADFLRVQEGASEAFDDYTAAARLIMMLEVLTPDRCETPQDWPLANACLLHAETLLRDFSINAEAGDEDRADTVRLAQQVGNVLRAQGRFAGARQADERAHRLGERLLGPEHPATLASALNLAYTLQSQGDLAGGRTLHERVYAARTRLLGPEHPDTLASMGSVATARWRDGDLAGAEDLEAGVLTTRERVLGPDHPDTLMAAENLAITRRDRGDLVGARALRERVYGGTRRTLGGVTEKTFRAAHALADTLAAIPDRKAALHLVAQLHTDVDALGNDLSDETRRQLHDFAASLAAWDDGTPS